MHSLSLTYSSKIISVLKFKNLFISIISHDTFKLFRVGDLGDLGVLVFPGILHAIIGQGLQEVLGLSTEKLL